MNVVCFGWQMIYVHVIVWFSDIYILIILLSLYLCIHVYSIGTVAFISMKELAVFTFTHDENRLKTHVFNMYQLKLQGHLF